MDEKGDQVISKKQLQPHLANFSGEALLIRTLPNQTSKQTLNYSDTNPTYIHPEGMQLIASSSVTHLLLDLPSVDRESDNGELLAHKIYWGYPDNLRLDRTITELIYVDDSIPDGLYLLELQVAPFKNDASPSRPVLYSLS